MSELKKVLIADDDPDLLGMLEFTLEDKGYKVETVSSGAKAITMVTQGAFNLILLDVVMPDMDGYHVAQSLYDEMGDKAPPIIIMSGRDLEKERQLALVSGAVDILQKPFQMDKMLGLVAKYAR